MAYVPPQRYHDRKRIWIIAIILIAVVFGSLWGYQTWQARQNPTWESKTICGFDETKSQELLQNRTKELYTIRDYQFYGESLNLFAQDYILGEQDDVRRKSISMHNLCNDETITYTMEDSADRQIDLVEPEVGFYALTIHDGQTEKQLVYDEVLHSEPFYTVRRDGKMKKVTLIADSSISEPALAQHTLFLEIEEVSGDAADVADVFIDPYGDRLSNGYLQRAFSANGISEAVEMQEAAEILKQELETYGLRVVLAKEQADEALGYYGEDGIMKKAYESHAKYYIELGMNSSNEVRYSGTEIYYSHYGSATLPNALMHALKKHTSLTPSNMYTWGERGEGVSTGLYGEGIDGKQIYDSLPALRESGAKISGAARFSDAATANREYVEATNSGMQAISINFIYLTNQADVATWKQEKETILATLAEAFATSVHVTP